MFSSTSCEDSGMSRSSLQNESQVPLWAAVPVLRLVEDKKGDGVFGEEGCVIEPRSGRGYLRLLVFRAARGVGVRPCYELKMGYEGGRVLLDPGVFGARAAYCVRSDFWGIYDCCRRLAYRRRRHGPYVSDSVHGHSGIAVRRCIRCALAIFRGRDASYLCQVKERRRCRPPYCASTCEQ